MMLIHALGDWREGSGPLYARLASGLQRLIERGSLVPGERLPSERAVAAALGVSRTTVVAAYDLLKRYHWLETRQGSGTRVANKAWHATPAETPRTFAVTPARAERRIDLASGGMPALPMVHEELRALVETEATALLGRSGYAPPGLWRLRVAIAEELTREGLASTPEQILVTSGAQQAFAMVCSMLVRPGHVVALENPTNPPAIDLCRSLRSELVPMPCDEHGIQTDEMVSRLSARPPRLLYVTPSYANPLGTDLPLERRRALAEFAARYRVMVIEDAAICANSIADKAISPHVSQFDQEGQVMLLGSMSKLFWGGLRIGWVRAREPQIAELIRHKLVADLGSAALEQALAVRLIRRVEEARMEMRQRMRSLLDLTLEALDKEMPEWSVLKPEGGPTIWIKLPAGMDARGFSEVCDRYGVAIAPGPLFSVTREHHGHFAIAYIQDESVLRQGLDRLTDAWKDYRSNPN